MITTSALPGHLVFLTWLPDSQATAPSARDFDRLYARLHELGAMPLHERIFGRTSAADEVLLARGSTAMSSGDLACGLEPTWIDCPPCGEGPVAGIHITALSNVDDIKVIEAGSGPAGVVARCADGFEVLALRDSGRADDRARTSPSVETKEALHWIRDAIESQGWGFHNVFRTWFYLRSILDWYPSFNGVRNELFDEVGLELNDPYAPIPASTGIEGHNRFGSWCTIDLLAARMTNSADTSLSRIVNPAQNEAPEYGSAFSRAMSLDTLQGRTVFVSGTAAINDFGSSVHVGSFRGQVDDTLQAIEALLEVGDATLNDVVQATAFVKRDQDVPELASILGERGLGDLPIVITRADVCRPELLFELDAVASSARSEFVG